MVELFEKDTMKNARQSSKGNQLKWRFRKNWYKADYTGYEGLAEYAVSCLLKESSLQPEEFIVYQTEEILYGKQRFRGCTSRDFLPEGWVPSDLVSVGGGQQLRAEAATALNNLKAAAEADGYTFNVISGYRTKATQISLYSNYMAQDPEGAPYLSAYPRSSEHELGLAMDISPDWSLHYDLLETGLGKWMTAHAHEYGWILRYPEGKTEVTGYVFEAWHYRYVGKSLAAEIKSSGLTLEEYYGSI